MSADKSEARKHASDALRAVIVKVVDFCTRHAWPSVVVALILATVCGVYAARHFAINTDIGKLISTDLPWRQRELTFDAAFPDRIELILTVVDAPTPELASQAATALVQKLEPRKDLFRSVRQPGGGAFFERYGMLFLPANELEQTMTKLAQGGPLIGSLSRDPTLRGLTQALSFGLLGVQAGRTSIDDLTRPLSMAADTVDDVLAGRRASFSWKVLLNGKPPEPRDLRRFIEVHPVLDFSALEPGKKATDAIRQAADELNLSGEYGARVRLTGPIPIADEEFATVQHGAVLNSTATIAVVLVILWLALKSARIIIAVFVSLLVGLAITAALGLMMVKALNLISIAFAVLFVGLGVDFGIQFSVRYRAERYEVDDLRDALRNAAKHVGAPLTLAAAAVAAGFLSFLPTDYRGVSELGQIAGVGMLIAFVTSVTVLPALLAIAKPPGETEQLGYAALAPVDRFLEKHRIPIIAATGLVVLLGLPLLYWLRFDFNPINLRNPNVESVATFLELRSDPLTGASSIHVLAPSLADAAPIADRLRKLPEVSRVTTLQSFVPDDQQRKLAIIRPVAASLAPALRSEPSRPPTDAENVAVLNRAADRLNQAAGSRQSDGANAARRLAALLTRLAKADQATRAKTETAFIAPLQIALGELRTALQVGPLTVQSLPPDLVREWMTLDGRARVEALPSGDPNDNETLRQFARAVLAVEPNAIGGPISILESGHTIVRAFIEAGIWALISIAILLWIALRRFGDVLLTLIPLLVAGVVTLEVCVLIGLPLNFANIIALPLLLGVGVAFKIYYIMAWRGGQTNLLQSSLTRAVIWSALTTATAFGSLWLSSHPGTSSMGKLLALSLVCTLAAAVLFQPALMGPPRETGDV